MDFTAMMRRKELVAQCCLIVLPMLSRCLWRLLLPQTMPICALIITSIGRIFACHGGISPDVSNLPCSTLCGSSSGSNLCVVPSLDWCHLTFSVGSLVCVPVDVMRDVANVMLEQDAVLVGDVDRRSWLPELAGVLSDVEVFCRLVWMPDFLFTR